MKHSHLPDQPSATKKIRPADDAIATKDLTDPSKKSKQIASQQVGQQIDSSRDGQAFANNFQLFKKFDPFTFRHDDPRKKKVAIMNADVLRSKIIDRLK